MKILLHPKAASALKRLDKEAKERILKKITKLKENKLLGKPLKYCTFRSLRVGDYRTIYEIVKDRIIILFIEHRKHVYDDFNKLF